MRHRGGRWGHPRARGRPRADRPATGEERLRVREGGPPGHPPDRSQLGRRPCRDLLRARLAEGAAVRGGSGAPVRVLRRSRDPVRALRQADRRHRRLGAARPRRARAPRPRQRGRGPAPRRRRRHPRDRAARDGVAGLHSPGTGIVDFGAVAAAYAEDLRGAGGSLATRLRGARPRGELALACASATPGA